MSIGEIVSEKIQLLPPDKQQEVLDFVEFLARPKLPASSPRRLKGIFSNAEIHLGADEIDEARRELWDGFPREDI
jgi:hypothetical protein